jgi:hypothetical protein
VSPRRTLASLAVACVTLAALAALAACGPSFQVVYEGDVRFEHCYALDESTATPMRDKADCWRDWMKHYTYGQTRDRIEYAASRQTALATAPQNPTDEALMEAAPGGGVRKNVISAPMPSSAFAAPPATMVDEAKPDAGPAPKSSTTSIPSHAPGSECIDACTKAWTPCKDGCTGKACETCDATYKACARTCYGDAADAGTPKPPKKK